MFGLFGCGSNVNHNSNGNQSIAEEQVPVRPYAELQMPDNVDMGVFEGDHTVRSITLQMANIGTDTLYVLGVQPECECTTIADLDSIVPPHVNGHVTVQLDLTDYPTDTIWKSFSIISNDRNGQVKTVTVFGVRK